MGISPFLASYQPISRNVISSAVTATGTAKEHHMRSVRSVTSTTPNAVKCTSAAPLRIQLKQIKIIHMWIFHLHRSVVLCVVLVRSQNAKLETFYLAVEDFFLKWICSENRVYTFIEKREIQYRANDSSRFWYFFIHFHRSHLSTFKSFRVCLIQWGTCT